MKIPTEIDLKSIAHPNQTVFDAQNIVNSTTRDQAAAAIPIANDTSLNNIKAIVQFASQSWRLSGVLMDPETEQPKPELNPQDIRKLSNIAEAMQEIVQSLGVRVIDRCGEDFHPGLPDVVVTEEPREGISKERIIRTIRPTILHGQTMVQRGEIDIAVPMEKKS